MKATKYRIGTLNLDDIRKLDDLSGVIELYIPEDAKTNPTPTLHIRGRELLPHHLQHYFVPYRKAFIAIRAAAIQLAATSTIGLFCEHYRWRKFNIPPPSWGPDEVEPGPDYWAYNHHVLHNGKIYICIKTHFPVAGESGNEPGIVGNGWEEFWSDDGEYPWSLEWKPGVNYKHNQAVSHPYKWAGHDDLVSTYWCENNHRSGELGGIDEPGKGAEWEYNQIEHPDRPWHYGDEFQSDLSYQYPGAHVFRRLGLSNGTTKLFDKDILAIFHGYTGKYTPDPDPEGRGGNIEGRAIDALTVSGTMKAGGILYGIEVDEADAGYEYEG